MGNRMFLPLNKLNKSTSTPRKEKDRKFPFELNFPYLDVDTVTYIIPDGFQLEYIPTLQQLIVNLVNINIKLKLPGIR